MGSFRIPGSQGLLSTACASDKGTLARTETPAPGSVGLKPRAGKLSDSDMDLIMRTAGRDIGGRVLPIDVLRQNREIHLERARDALVSHGRDSWAYQFEEAVLLQYGRLIEGHDTPQGKAAQSIQQLLDKAKNPRERVDVGDFSEHFRVLLEAERERQLKGKPVDPDEPSFVDLFQEVGEVMQERLTDETRKLLDRIKRDDASVTDEQVRDKVRDILGLERQSQLLGIERGGTIGFLGEVIEVLKQRHRKQLDRLVEQGGRPGSSVAPAELDAAVRKLLADERQSQLLGSEDSSPDLWEAIRKAAEVREKLSKLPRSPIRPIKGRVEIGVPVIGRPR